LRKECPATATVKDVMTRNVVAMRERAEYKEIIAVMRRRHVSAFPVLDDRDRVVGWYQRLTADGGRRSGDDRQGQR
jgi:CBS-domain-containing membrane protein